jgi:hypothetical protein
MVWADLMGDLTRAATSFGTDLGAGLGEAHLRDVISRAAAVLAEAQP